jgi:uncharacterized protein YdaU (DUF1376 family)
MCQVVLPHRKLSLKVEGLDYASTGEPMYSKKQFTALEAMCREQAGLAKSEMEYSLMKYWLAEAEEWKQLRQSVPFKERIASRSSDPAKSNSVKVE